MNDQRLADVIPIRRQLALCRSCTAPISWHLTAQQNLMPLDPTPHPGGNVRVDQDGIAHVVGSTIDLFDTTDDGTRYQPHWASCPQAGEWRTP
jgi:hypothetical protein